MLRCLGCPLPAAMRKLLEKAKVGERETEAKVLSNEKEKALASMNRRGFWVLMGKKNEGRRLIMLIWCCVIRGWRGEAVIFWWDMLCGFFF